LIPLVLDVATGASKSIRILGDDYPTPDGTCVRDYIHVEDLAEAHLAALEADGGLCGDYNVGTGRGASVREVIETARRVTGKAIQAEVAPRRAGDPPELVADPSKINSKLGWTAKRDLESAIRSAWALHGRKS
jgi:UDP-glucose 4-epimerase